MSRELLFRPRTQVPPPNGFFVAVWSLWYVDVLYSLWRVFQPGGWTWAVGVIVGFAVFETMALKLTWRWSLSACVTWTCRRLSKHDRAFAGWNNIAWLVAFPIGLLVCLVPYVLLPAPWGAFLGVGLGVPTTKGLHDHWLRPDVHG